MANFLDDLSVYNAKAALVISQVVANGDTGKANMMSSLKTTANDTTLSEAIRLNALTALINLGSLLDVPLPPYFPLTTTYANTQTYVGIHDDLTGLQGGAPGDYQHITTAERNLIANAATLGDITFTNLSGVYTNNANLVNAFAGKQNALSGTGFVKISGTTISYDNSTYLTTISGIAAGGELSGTYPNPALSNAAVISKLLTGFTGVALPTPITSSDTILSAMQKLNNNISSLIVSPSGVASVALTTNSSGVFTTTTTPQTGAATLDVSLNTQTASKFLASPTSASGTPTFRAFSSIDLPNSGATAGTYGSSSLIPQIVVDAKGRITAITTVAAAAGGQVNSVTLTQPGIFTAATNIGTASAVNLNYGLSQQIANYVWAGPISGANATPTFRALVEDDIPSLSPSKITNLTNILDGFLTNNLSDGSIWIGNTSNAAVQRVLSGDVTVSNTGVTAIGLAKVQYDMIQDVTTQTLLGRYDAVDGEVEQVTLSGDFLLNSSTGVLSLSSPVSPVVSTKGDLLGHDLTVQQRVPSNNINGSILLVNNSATGVYANLGLNWVAMSGDATITAAGALTIAGNAVTLGKMANLPANRIIGNNTGSSATPLALTATEVTAMLNQFTTSAKGLVPASGAVGATYFLNATGGWSVPAGGGGGSGTVTSANQYSIPYYSLSPSGTTVTGLTPDTGTDGRKFLSQVITSGNAAAPVWVQSTGSGSVVLDTSPSLTTPNIGDAIADSINNVVITATASTTTLTIADGKTFTVSNTLTFTGTDNSSVAFGAGGTVAYVGLANSWTSGIKQTFAPSATTAGINVGTLAGQPSSPANGDLVYNSTATALQAYINGAWVSLGAGGGGGSGTVNSGTQYQLAYYATTGTAVSGLTTGTSGQVLALSAGLVPTWTTLGTSTTLTNIGAATASATLTNANSTITWNWNSNTTANAFVLGSTSITSGNLLTLGISGSTAVSAENLVITNSSTANTSGRGLDISITGATNSGNTFGAFISNTKTGTTSTNTALGLTASGGTTNYALDVTAGISRFGVGTASVPQIILTPSSAITISGTVNGSIWYDTASSNSSLTLYKDAAYTKILTKDRNPDFVTSAQGVVVADASGNFTKSADLTALGVYSVYADTGNITTNSTETTMIGTSLVGSTTLPANFFAVGKTLRIFASGTVTNAGSDNTTIRFKLGGTTIGTFSITQMQNATGNDFVMEAYIICNAAGASGTVRIGATFFVEGNTVTGEHTYYLPLATQSGTINTTTSLAMDVTNQWGQASCIMVVNFMTCYYLN